MALTQHLFGMFLRVLAAIDRRFSGGAENELDMFDGDKANWRFYRGWLSSVCLLEPSSRGFELDAELSDLGRSVLLTGFQATRRARLDPATFCHPW